MLLLVGQVLGQQGGRVSKSHVCRVSLSRYLAVDADHLAAVITIVGEHVLVALDAEGVVLPQHVPGHVPRHSQESRVMGPACARQDCRRSDGRRGSRTRYPSPW